MKSMNGMRQRIAVLVAAGLLAASAAPAEAAKAYSAFYVFGDSLSDAGNVFNLSGGTIPPQPYVGGHFSNGPTWAEDLSLKLGLGALRPSTKGGTDYAYGYAIAAPGVPVGVVPPVTVPGLGQQITDYTKAHGKVADSSALYAVWIGSNDILDAFAGFANGQISGSDAETAVANGIASELTAIDTLVQMGAKHLLIGAIPNLGLTPVLNATPFAATAALVASDYNAALLAAVMKGAPGVDISYLDTFDLIDNAVADPSRYGFTDVTTACVPDAAIGTTLTCANPDQHLFWDDVHPTRVAHQDIADLALNTLGVAAVPLPDSAPLFGAALLGLAGLSVVARRRSDTQAR